MRPLIFLDFDGVLNSVQSSLVYRGFSTFDPVSVGLVSRLCEQANALIVVSSSWRLGRTLPTLKADMDAAGASVLSPLVIGMTPRLNKERGHEIAAWLAQKPHAGTYVILDDDSDMLPGQAFVHTSVSRGFGLCEYVEALEHLMPGHNEAKDLRPYVGMPRHGMRKAAGWY